MDKNTLTGFVLILAILVGFSLLNKPSKEELAARTEQQHISDSLAAVAQQEQKMRAVADSARFALNAEQSAQAADSARNAQFGVFSKLTEGTNTLDTLSNGRIAVTFSSKGGRIASVRLKNFQDKDSMPLDLFNEQESNFNLSFFSKDNRLINTQDLFFERVESKNPLQFIYRLAITDSSYLDFVYELQKDDYMVNMSIRGNNLKQVLPANTNVLDLAWGIRLKQQEQGRTFEERYSQVDYKFLGDEVDKLNANKDDEETVDGRLRWVSFKDQFFSSIIICDKGFSSNKLSSKVEAKNSPYLKNYSMTSALEFNLNGSQKADLRFYFGPIGYSQLRSYDKGVPAEEQLDFDKIVPLGGKLFRWVNTLIILPLFKLFGSFINNFGIIIILLTIVIKLIIYPFTHKSFMSTAKMRVLNPQIQEINARYPGQENAAQRSQATMDLYKKVGVSPMGGCLPTLFQMPVLFAMFSFFPSSIELRHESFLWANDLSTYDVLVQWSGNIPLVTKYFGNHVSLFCLLMTITNLLYTHINMKNQPANNQMPGMKTMSYLMPVMFLFMFNQYAAGLSLYFFVSTLITIVQTYAYRKLVNEDKLLAQLNENKKKPVKKSKFQTRLEEMQREQQRMLKEQQSGKKPQGGAKRK